MSNTTGATRVPAFIEVEGNPTSKVIDGTLVGGVHNTVANATERNALHASVRKLGMFVFQENSNTWYKLTTSPGGGTDADWTVSPLGPSASGFGTGTVDPILGQPVQGVQQGNASQKTIPDLGLFQTIPGNYSPGTTPWQVGVWTVQTQTVSRTQTAGSAPILRISLPPTFSPGGARIAQINPGSNLMYVYDSTGPKVYTLDITPTLDVYKNFIESTPGVIDTLDLSSGPMAGRGNDIMVVDTTSSLFWFFSPTDNTYRSVSFDGLTTHSYATTAGYYFTDATFANGQLLVTTNYSGPLSDPAYVGQQLLTIATNGTVSHTTILSDPSSPPAYAWSLNYDPITNQVVATQQQGTSVQILDVSSVPVTIIQTWDITQAGAFIIGPGMIMNGGTILIPTRVGNADTQIIYEFTSVGAPTGQQYNPPPRIETVNGPIFVTVYDVTNNYNVVGMVNTGTGALAIAPVTGTATLSDVFLGGLTQWSSTLEVVTPTSPGIDFGVGTGDFVRFNDNGNDTYLMDGVPFGGTGKGLIAIANGNNPSPSPLMTYGSFVNAGRPLSRSDRIVTQLSLTPSGLIYKGPPTGAAAGAGATLLLVSITGSFGSEGSSYGSWVYIFDTTHGFSDGPPTHLVNIYTFNPNTLADPVFTVTSNGSVSVQLDPGTQNWTVVVMAAVDIIAGSL